MSLNERTSDKTQKDELEKYMESQDQCATTARPMSQIEKLDELFRYHHPRPDQIPKYQAVRSAAKYLGEVILTNTPPGSDQSEAIRKLREVVMTANSSIALDGLNF